MILFGGYKYNTYLCINILNVFIHDESYCSRLGPIAEKVVQELRMGRSLAMRRHLDKGGIEKIRLISGK